MRPPLTIFVQVKSSMKELNFWNVRVRVARRSRERLFGNSRSLKRGMLDHASRHWVEVVLPWGVS
jgi:hypothetical protein